MIHHGYKLYPFGFKQGFQDRRSSGVRDFESHMDEKVYQQFISLAVDSIDDLLIVLLSTQIILRPGKGYRRKGCGHASRCQALIQFE